MHKLNQSRDLRKPTKMGILQHNDCDMTQSIVSLNAPIVKQR